MVAEIKQDQLIKQARLHPSPPAAFAALGIDPRDVAEDAEPAADEAATNVEAEPKQRPKTSRTKEPKSRRTRDGSKQAQLIAMLRRAKGVTIDLLLPAARFRVKLAEKTAP